MRHRSPSILLAALAALLVISGCNLDPNKAKVRFVENGDKYLAQGKLKEAILLYRNAIKKDPLYAIAYRKLGDAEVKRGGFGPAVAAYRRAVELLPPKESEEAAGKLADIYLVAYAGKPKASSPFLTEIQDLSRSLKSKNPASFQAYRLDAFLALTDEKDPDRFKKAIELFRKADAIKPKQPELRFAMCQVLNQAGQWPESEALAKTLLAESPEYLPSYSFLATQYKQRNQLQDAERILTLRTEKHPKVAAFVIDKAGFLWVTQRQDQANRILEELLSKEYSKPDVRRQVGEFYSRSGSFDKAYQVYEEGVAKFPAARTEFRVNMAGVLVAQGKQAEAMKVVEQALQDDPSNSEAVSAKAALQLASGDQGKMQSAINDLQGLVGKSPQNVLVRYNLGKAYQNRGDLDAARVQFEEVVKRSPSMAAAHIGLAQVFLQKRDFGRAIGSAEEVMKFDPKNLAARVIKVNALTNSANLRQARSELMPYMADAPNSPDLRYQLGILDFLDNRLKEAEVTFRDLSKRFPGDNRLSFALAELMIRTGRQAEGLALLQEELKRNPKDRNLKLSLARSALRVNKLDVAEEQYRAMMAADGANPDLFLGLGEILRRRNQNQEAVTMLRKARDLAPNSAGANLQLAMTLDSMGAKGESLPLYEAVIKTQPDNLIALNNVAFYYADSGKDLEMALTYAQRARQRAPNNDDVADTLAWVYIKKNLPDSAVSILRDITARKPKNPTYHYHLGVAMSQKGDKPAARQSLNTALSLKPSRDEETRIRELLAKVS